MYTYIHKNIRFKIRAGLIHTQILPRAWALFVTASSHSVASSKHARPSFKNPVDQPKTQTWSYLIDAYNFNTNL